MPEQKSAERVLALDVPGIHLLSHLGRGFISTL
jgi:hypothetical protein